MINESGEINVGAYGGRGRAAGGQSLPRRSKVGELEEMFQTGL